MVCVRVRVRVGLDDLARAVGQLYLQHRRGLPRVDNELLRTWLGVGLGLELGLARGTDTQFDP